MGTFKFNIDSPVDADEVEKGPDERNEEQRTLRSAFCPLSWVPREAACVGDSFIQRSVICVASQRDLTNV